MSRFLVLVPASEESEAGAMPTEEQLAEMGAYNEQLVKAGVMLDGAGLHPTKDGVRVTFSGGKASVTDGPFTESKELVAGYWIWECKTKEEAIEWLKRAPFDGGTRIELRQLFDFDEFEQGPAIDRARELEKEIASRK